MDRITAPYKVDLTVETWRGEVTAEQIASGAAGDPAETSGSSQWYEATGEPITDPARIAHLEAAVAAKGH